jgi:hypothetical protein
MSGERDPVTGQFLNGHTKVGGRQARRDVYTIAAALAEGDGFDLEQAVYRVVRSLILQAEEGDAACAKLVLSYLCGEPKANDAVHLQVVTGVPTLRDLVRESLNLDQGN